MNPPGYDHPQHGFGEPESRDDAPAPDYLLESAMAFWRSAVLLSAYELGLFAFLASGPHDACSVAERLGLHPEAASNLLEAVVTLRFVEQSGDHYCNSLEASVFLDPVKPTYMGRWLTMASAAMRDMTDLSSQLRTVSTSQHAQPSLADQVRADIAEILGAAFPNDGA